MHRVILRLGGVEVTSWGVMLVIAFIAGIWLAERRCQKYGVPRAIIPDLSLVLIVAGVVGGRLAYVIENFSSYAEHPGEIFKVWEGGLIFYGGFILAIVCGIIFVKRKHISVARMMDIAAPSVALGLGFARIGCFLNGCCYGKQTNLPWGVVFPSDSPAGWVFDAPIPIHPAQLYSSIGAFSILAILLVVEKKGMRRASGYLFLMFLVLYSVGRFFIDFLRYYEPKVYLLGGLTHNQFVSIFIFLGSCVIILCKSLIVNRVIVKR